ncbi:MAG: hypothetical protein M1835_004143 [Candelina submexicana]|nr:MAG: hypothetical protein M1835_004143 [Candelina submexicana]
MTEDKMFIAIFNYIEHLFGKIKPKQLFFMAIDGVAPRAKMNQQRARRFRTALDAEVAKEKAIRSGAEMPTEDAFDSNCITPGTGFMARLTQQLRYFINKKVSEDADWQGVEIVLSGHEVPGEGEHKIMEFIRLTKAQLEYDPNVRHCLYGLDADLIMLGLLSHDPHFCLLREEVTFGRQNQKKSKELEHQNFYLMHLCMVREYLELEFQELKEPGVLGFPFDLERVIDDFILMAFFVGNDFLPNLPNLHINEGALAAMFRVYKEVLPKANGYINEGGVINLERLAILLDGLLPVTEYHFFEAEHSNANWLKGKRIDGVNGEARNPNKGPLEMSTPQKDLFRKIKKFVNNRSIGGFSQQQPLDLPHDLPARDRKFVEGLAEALRLDWRTIEDGDGQRHVRLIYPQKASVADEDNDDEEEDEESQMALLRVIKRYENARVVDTTPEQVREEADKRYHEKLQTWKNKYYKDKFDWGPENREELKNLTENYVQDVKKGLGADLNFKLGQPFRPFQQLMGVLPDRSKKIVPTPYHDLMTSIDSPIIDFYPRDFELDMNGKKMEWEAVVKIPFIDENRLLPAMATKEHLLSQEERARNEFGVTLKFSYAPNLDFTYPSSFNGVFPDLEHCHCQVNIFDLPTMDGLDVYVGLMKGVKLGEAALAGFPSLKTLPQAGVLGFQSVNVFQQDSRNESMVVTLLDADTRTKVEVAKAKLDRKVHVNYPFLQEAKVVRVSDELFDYVLPQDGTTAQAIPIPHSPQEIDQWRKKAERIENFYSKRLGMIIGPVESLTHVEMLKGLTKTDEGATVKQYAQIAGLETDYASQVVVDEVISEDQRFLEKAALSIDEEFPTSTRAFFLGEFNYGRPCEVVRSEAQKAEIWVSTVKGREAEFGREIALNAERTTPYIASYNVARMLNLNPLVLSKITASFHVMLDDQRLNLGLNLKFEAKKLKVLGYSRRGSTGWEFSQKAIDLLQQYMVQFPEFIAGIQRKPQGDLYDATDFYPKDQASTKMKEIQAWLKQVESKNFEKVPLDAQQLDSDVVRLIEQAADQAAHSGQPTEGKKIKGVPRSALLKPSDAEHRLGNQRFAPGDRIVYVQDSGRVPIASRGTVVGLTRTSRTTLLDILFDMTFMSGTSLGERCSPFRGSTVPVSSVLNITDKQLVAGSKAAVDHRQPPSVQPLTTNGYGAPTGPGGRGQYHDASAPAPLRGSFRGAVTGQQNSSRGGSPSGRGRGGPGYDSSSEAQRQVPIRQGQPSQPSGFRGRGGFTNGSARGGRGAAANQYVNRNGYGPIDNGDSTEGVVRNNPNFRPQSYANVPPPTNFETRGRGRGRGGLRGSQSRGGGSFRGPRGSGRGTETVQKQS